MQSLVISRKPGERFSRRRPLWEEFYPRIRHEILPQDAARIVVRHLWARVSIVNLANLSDAVAAIWLRQVTDERGFEIILVAALHSVGVPARLSATGRAEFWNGANWEPAPKPPAWSSW